MPGRRRSTAQLVRDRRRIADLYLQGWIQADIAAELGISQQTVSNDLKALQVSWLDSSLVDFNAAKSQELAKVDRLEREYWVAWLYSCEDAEGQAGDPRFLAGVQWCIGKRCKILGIDAASKVESVSLSVDLDGLTDAQLVRIKSGESLASVISG